MSGFIEPINPEQAETKANLALRLQATGRIREAIPLLMDLVAQDPTRAQWRRALAEALWVFPIRRAGPKVRNLLSSLCRDEELQTLLLPSVVLLIGSDEGFQALQKNARRGEDPFVAVVPAVAAFLREPLLLAALPHMPMGGAEGAALEEVFTHLRRSILLRFERPSDSEPVDPALPLEFVCALARQCFYGGYAFFVAVDELQRVARLRGALQDMLNEPLAGTRSLEPSLAVAALYDSLHAIDGAARLLAYPMTEWSEAFRPIVQEQIEEPGREREIAVQLSAITPIDDPVSRAVRAQYEANPYPRWVSLPSYRQRYDRRTVKAPGSRCDHSYPTPPGAGTHCRLRHGARTHFVRARLWRQPGSRCRSEHRQSGLRCPDDGAVRESPNITYRQADILKLGNLDARFAVIECVGVLHHLDDPMAGWRVLVDLLEPDGLMRIALYSEIGRHAIQGAKDFVRQEKFPATPEGIRCCRHAIMGLPDGHPARKVMTWGDFYSLDGCRDLIMHVREHLFTLPRLQRCLDQLGLHLLGFECTTATLNHFNAMFPGGNEYTNLEAWHRFEAAHPETFSEMYCFWCCRKS